MPPSSFLSGIAERLFVLVVPVKEDVVVVTNPVRSGDGDAGTESEAEGDEVWEYVDSEGGVAVDDAYFSAPGSSASAASDDAAAEAREPSSSSADRVPVPEPAPEPAVPAVAPKRHGHKAAAPPPAPAPPPPSQKFCARGVRQCYCLLFAGGTCKARVAHTHSDLSATSPPKVQGGKA